MLPEIFGEMSFCRRDPKRALQIDAPTASADDVSGGARVKVNYDVEFITVRVAHDKAVFDTVCRGGSINVAGADDAKIVLGQKLDRI